MTATITDQREAAVLADVPNQLLIGGRWRASSSGATLPVEDPATGQTLVHVADATPEDGEAALSAAVAAQAVLGGHGPARAGRDPAAGVRGDRGRGRRAGPAHDPGDGQVGGRVAGRDPLRRRVLPLVLRGGRAHRRPVRHRTRRPHPPADEPAARRTLPAHHPVELPDGHGHPQDRPRRRRGLHHGRQAGRADPAEHARAGPHPRRRRTARRRAQRDHHVGLRAGHGAADPRPAAAQAVVHRLHPGRAAADRAVGAAGAAHVHGARRERPVRRLRRRRPRPRRRRCRPGQDAQRRPGVHRREPLPRAGRDRRPSSPAASPTGSAR